MATSNQPWFPMNTNIRSEWKEAVVPLSFAILAAAGLLSLASDASAAELTGSATLTSDYVWRGSTQTSGDPARDIPFAQGLAVYGDLAAAGRVLGHDAFQQLGPARAHQPVKAQYLALAQR